ncbi:MAG: hypothetical protein AAF609_25655 [Cyanobacteria bacterium P01_C01_bin.120]
MASRLALLDEVGDGQRLARSDRISTLQGSDWLVSRMHKLAVLCAYCSRNLDN